MYQIPEGFGCVEDTIYRASHVRENNVMFLETLNLKTILVLNPERQTGAFKEFCDRNSIAVHHYGIQPWRPASEWRFIGIHTYQDAIKLAVNKTTYPLLIVDASNMFVGVLRRLQHWAFSSVLAEYTAMAGTRASYAGELFLELIEPKCVFYEDKDQKKELELEDQGPMSLTVLLPSKKDLPDWFFFQQEEWLRLNT